MLLAPGHDLSSVAQAQVGLDAPALGGGVPAAPRPAHGDEAEAGESPLRPAGAAEGVSGGGAAHVGAADRRRKQGRSGAPARGVAQIGHVRSLHVASSKVR